MKVEVSGIEWDADNVEDVEDLSTEMTLIVPASEIDDIWEYISDKISDESGFTHAGFSYSIIVD